VRLALAAHGVAVGTPVCVALSGGLDSTVLLHALVALGVAPLRAAHVDHGLQPQSGAWAQQCERLCAGLGVPLAVHRVTVDARGGEGPEGAARRVRYAVLAAGLAPGEVLATAHHRDDQAETVLLNLVRGGGVAGLGGVPAAAALGPGRLLRPLLELPRAALAEYARGAALAWVEDPSNADRGLDRNFVRHEVLPLLAQRWPAASVTLARSGRLCAEAAGLLDELAAQDARRVGRRGRVRVAALAELAPARQRNLLRHLCRLALGSVPSEARLREGLAQLLAAGPDRNPALEWTGGSIRRHRGELHVLPPLPGGAGPAGGKLAATAGASLDLGGLGRLRLVRARGAGLATARLGESLEVRWRRGGERLRPAGDAHTRELKKLLQDRGIVPWMRPHVPLVYAGDALAAVGTLWVADEYAARAGEPGLRLRWERHPPLE
jgi:tRNA(Ile)-lysidine synthase